MGPFPHDAASTGITETNPMGTDGFEFVEFASPDPHRLGQLFEQLGFEAVASHRSKEVTLYAQGDISFLVNAEPDSFAQQFSRDHGPSVCAIAFRVADAASAYERALSLGATPVATRPGPMELNLPGIEGIGGSHIYFVDRYGADGTIYDVDFVFNRTEDDQSELKNGSGDKGLHYLDHLTHNVYRGNMNKWAQFYEKYFNFREIRYFDIEGKLTGLMSRAMTSPCGKIRIPINESADDKSQIEEYLSEYRGEGIQHIAMGSQDIYQSVSQLRQNEMDFMPAPPPTYYENLDQRVANHGEDVEQLKALGILLDGAPKDDNAGKPGILLQIFTNTVIGPVFFEIIQRKGDEGFGEGNFRALFESIEQDQIRRGVLDDETNDTTGEAARDTG